MSEKQYLQALNEEIQKLNGIIDFKIMKRVNYKRESLRHKELLRKIRKERRMKYTLSPVSFDFLSRV